jgi:hypothetical protein
MEAVAVDPPIRTLRRRIHGSPSITRFTIVRTYPTRFELNLPDTDATVIVPRNPGENARSAIRRYLTA